MEGHHDEASLVRALQLVPHPEGGFYRETYRSPLRVGTSRGERAAVTAIHFLLPARPGPELGTLALPYANTWLKDVVFALKM